MMRFDSLRRLRTWPAALLLAVALPLSGCGDGILVAPEAANTVHVTTFGDSNTDIAWGTDPPRILARSYVSDAGPRLAPGAHNHPAQLAGLVEARWRANQTLPIRVVNHGISGTTTGGGGHGGRNRNDNGALNSRSVSDGVTRFEAEVLGRGYPWTGAGIRRVNAYVPGPADFAYISMGTNDRVDGITGPVTLENLEWMVERWVAAGHAPDHLVLTTLPPRSDVVGLGEWLPTINAGVRELAARTGTGLIDLAEYTSPDDGLTWRDASLHVGDKIHYTTAVRAWIADQLVAYMVAHPLPVGAAP